jgi:hypothetical protein
MVGKVSFCSSWEMSLQAYIDDCEGRMSKKMTDKELEGMEKRVDKLIKDLEAYSLQRYGVKKPYCTQNNGDCDTCSLKNYGRDCRNHPIDRAS